MALGCVSRQIQAENVVLSIPSLAYLHMASSPCSPLHCANVHRHEKIGTTKHKELCVVSLLLPLQNRKGIPAGFER